MPHTVGSNARAEGAMVVVPFGTNAEGPGLVGSAKQQSVFVKGSGGSCQGRVPTRHARAAVLGEEGGEARFNVAGP